MEIPTLEEIWNKYKEYERQGIDPFKPVEMPQCSDCTRCISMCEKRNMYKQEETNV